VKDVLLGRLQQRSKVERGEQFERPPLFCAKVTYHCVPPAGPSRFRPMAAARRSGASVRPARRLPSSVNARVRLWPILRLSVRPWAPRGGRWKQRAHRFVISLSLWVPMLTASAQSGG
jgi:hypothetical protein